MTPQEKAKQLYDKFKEETDGIAGYNYDSVNIKCALIAIDEIIESSPRYSSDVDWDDAGGTHQYYYEAQQEEALNYWKEVRQEVYNLKTK